MTVGPRAALLTLDQDLPRLMSVAKGQSISVYDYKYKHEMRVLPIEDLFDAGFRSIYETFRTGTQS